MHPLQIKSLRTITFWFWAIQTFMAAVVVKTQIPLAKTPPSSRCKVNKNFLEKNVEKHVIKIKQDSRMVFCMIYTIQQKLQLEKEAEGLTLHQARYQLGIPASCLSRWRLQKASMHERLDQSNKENVPYCLPVAGRPSEISDETLPFKFGIYGTGTKPIQNVFKSFHVCTVYVITRWHLLEIYALMIPGC